jgi:hypothetical protein
MKNADISDPVFRKAVELIDAGHINKLQLLLKTNTGLIAKRLPNPAKGYFSRPYLLWFVAGNPVRHEQLPANIPAITLILVETARQYAADSFQVQLDYTLALVATGRVPRDCGVQIELMDLLLKAGARPGTGLAALANGNIQAAAHLLANGGELTLPAAVGLDREADVKQLLKQADKTTLELALVVAAFFGKPDLIQILIHAGANVNAYPSPESGFHAHATALHQAVYSGSPEAVELLVAAGADPGAKDKIYEGTPLDWAVHMQKDNADIDKNKQYAAIAAYLDNQAPAH